MDFIFFDRDVRAQGGSYWFISGSVKTLPGFWLDSAVEKRWRQETYVWITKPVSLVYLELLTQAICWKSLQGWFIINLCISFVSFKSIQTDMIVNLHTVHWWFCIEPIVMHKPINWTLQYMQFFSVTNSCNLLFWAALGSCESYSK